MNKSKISEFPITPYLEEICSKLNGSASRFLILTAQTAAGKSTVFPLSLLDAFKGKVLMTEPRRLAVLGVASRLSSLLEEECGSTIGYKIHLEKKITSKTRLEVVTEAILVRQLQEDPALENYQVVVLDEFHERSIYTDMALAFLKEAMTLRDDLFVVVMSATMDTQKLQEYLGDDTPIVEVPGRQFPVDISYESNMTVEQAVLKEVNERSPGNILAFLPGIAEIRRAEENLKEQLPADKPVVLQILHSSITLDEQKKVLAPWENSMPRRVILSSAIAETSLTVPGVTCVIDSGLSRINRMNVESGMERLSTETESEFSATQRAGRAGRLQAGKCIRLWSKADPRIKNMPAEIRRADLAILVLECAERGVYNLQNIDWFEPPEEAAWNECFKLLNQLRLLDDAGRITKKGKAALGLGVHPRLACIALKAGAGVGTKTSATTTTCGGSTKALQLVLKYSQYAKSAPNIQKRFLEDLQHRIESGGYSGDSAKEGMLLLCGYPDRLARRTSELGVEPAEYQFAGGRKALLYECGGKASEWIVAPEVNFGNRQGTIQAFEPLETGKVNEWLPGRTVEKTVCQFVNGKVEKQKVEAYGVIIIKSQRLAADKGDLAAAWCTEVLEKGIMCLPSDKKLDNFLQRASFYFEHNGKGNLEKQIQEKVNDWLPPFITAGTKLTAETVYSGLYWFLDGANIDKDVPEQITLPNGKKTKVKYEKLASPEDKNKLIIRPVIEIIIQRAFGCFETPRICGVKALLRLLSPAQRPLQITDDLENFWTGAWPEICKEMKGRYPKHNWDYKIVEKGE